MLWTLTTEGVEKTLKELRITNLERALSSASTDRVTFDQHRNFDADLSFSYDAKIVIKKDSEIWFTGRILTPTRAGGRRQETASASAISYAAAGPWNDMERIVFEQFWKKPDGEMSASVVILGKTIKNQRLSCGQQIKEILDFAISQGAFLSYQIGDLMALDILPPETEQTDITCAEAVGCMLRWHKDVTTFFDYSAARPVLRFVKTSAATVVTADIAGTGNARNLTITERPDLLVRGVVIRFSRTINVDGFEYHDLVTDYAGEQTGRDVIKMTIDLEGISRTRETARIKTEAAPSSDETIRTWLISKNPWMASADIDSIEWTLEGVDSGGLGYVLTEGVITDWMDCTYGYGTISARARITYANGTIERINVSDSQTFISTSKEFWIRTITTSVGEPIPTGLAAKIYGQLSTLQYQGSITLIENESSGLAAPGRVLNLTGGRTEWITMRAQIQQVIERPAVQNSQAITTIIFGPAAHLNAQDFIELTRANRLRTTTTHSGTRETGRANEIELGGAGVNSNSTSGASVFHELTISSDITEHAIILDPDDETFLAGKALVIKDDGLTTEWGSAMPPIGEDDKEYMVLQINNVGDPAVKTPVWGWLRGVEASEE